MWTALIYCLARRFTLLGGLLLLVLLNASPGIAQAPLQEITVDTVRFRVEIAQTLEEKQRGLMFRTQLPDDQGMLFVMSTPRKASFWMKNTYIPLDLLYFDAQGQLLEMDTDVPPCATDPCPVYTSGATHVKYILEINGGLAERLGVKPGDRLSWH